MSQHDSRSPSLVDMFLTLPGVHYGATRFGGSSLRRRGFDAKFHRGIWGGGGESSEVLSAVTTYARGGAILMLGCGAGRIVSQLPAAAYSSFLGVDISPAAIALARSQENEKVQFVVGDMTSFPLDRSFDVVVFSESLYYVPGPEQLPLLERLASHLTPTGALIVTLADPERYTSLVQMLRTRFSIEVDRLLLDSRRRMMVCRR